MYSGSGSGTTMEVDVVTGSEAYYNITLKNFHIKQLSIIIVHM